MAGLNKVELIGRLGGDPESRNMPNGDAVCNITMATSDTWKDKQTGQRQEKTEWHRVVFFGKLAVIAGQYLRKGSQCYVEGKNRTREWEKDGVKRYTTEVVVDSFDGKLILLDGKPQEGSQAPQQQAAVGQQRQARQPERYGSAAPNNHQPAAQQPPPDYDMNEDIPF